MLIFEFKVLSVVIQLIAISMVICWDNLPGF